MAINIELHPLTAKPNTGRSALYLFDLMVVLVSRDVTLLYKRSVLGILWTLISPLLQLLVYVFVFQNIIKLDIPQFPSYVFTGLLVWQWFHRSMVHSAGVIIESRPLIRQPGFPISILPMAVLMTGLVHLFVSLPVLIGVLAIDDVSVSPAMLWIPVLLALQILLMIPFAYFLAGLNVAFRDTQHTLNVLLQLLFFLTPVLYTADRVPVEYHSLYFSNPMVHIVTAYRQVLIAGEPPDWVPLSIIAGSAAVLLPIGYRIFIRQSRRFVEEL
jgi:lipopolysaccharide transport system permease protein